MGFSTIYKPCSYGGTPIYGTPHMDRLTGAFHAGNGYGKWGNGIVINLLIMGHSLIPDLKHQ